MWQLTVQAISEGTLALAAIVTGLGFCIRWIARVEAAKTTKPEFEKILEYMVQVKGDLFKINDVVTGHMNFPHVVPPGYEKS